MKSETTLLFQFERGQLRELSQPGQAASSTSKDASLILDLPDCLPLLLAKQFR